MRATRREWLVLAGPSRGGRVGITVEMLVGLIDAGLATATAERVVAGSKTIEIALRITEAGRRMAQGQR